LQGVLRDSFRIRRAFGASFLLAALAVFSAPSSAGDVHVMISGGFSAAYDMLTPHFEKFAVQKLVTVRGPSMGDTPEAIPNRIDRGEPVDVVIMVSEALDGLIKRGKVMPDSKVDLARSKIAMAVKAGAPKPDISTVDALKHALLSAKTIAYSDSASGVYLQNVLFPKLGISEQLKGHARMIPAEPVGRVVARGDAEIGFQQLSELKPVPGIEIVGLLPEGAQKVTTFSAGIATGTKNYEGAYALVKFLSLDFVRDPIERTGLEPVAGKMAY
jgi:molybdate transport system substrate-binding protein